MRQHLLDFRALSNPCSHHFLACTAVPIVNSLPKGPKAQLQLSSS